jgi:hypothetical protein
MGEGKPQAPRREARSGSEEGSMTGDKDRQEQAEQAVEQLLDGYSKLVAMATDAGRQEAEDAPTRRQTRR